MNKDVIVFDLFGVVFSKGLKSSINKLADIYDLDEDTISKVYKNWEMPFDEGKIKSYEFWQNINRDLNRKVSPKMLNNIVLSSYKIDDTTLKLINHLRTKFTLVIYSNFRREWYEYLNKKHRISKLFDKIYISSDYGLLKPSFLAYDQIVKDSGIPKRKHLLIDDNIENISSFKNWGGQTILFENPYTTELEIREKYSNIFNEYEINYSGIILILNNDKVVLQRRDNKKGIENPNKLSVFGGRAKFNESPIECAIRELFEETGIKAIPSQLTLVKKLAYPLSSEKWIKCTYYTFQDFDINDIIISEGQGFEVTKIKEAAINYEVTEIPRFIFKNII